MVPRNLNHFFKQQAAKALGEARGSQFVFKDLRDSYNEAILDSNVNEEIKDTLMGHLRESAKSSYSLSTASVVRIYRDEVFPNLTVNGWKHKQQATELDALHETVQGLTNALSHIEMENASYKTRIDGLHQQMTDLVDTTKSQTEEQARMKAVVQEVIASNMQMHKEYDVLYMLINSSEDSPVIRQFRELAKTFRMNWEDDNH